MQDLNDYEKQGFDEEQCKVFRESDLWANHLIEKGLQVVNQVYMDIRLLKDIDIGALMLKVTNKTDYEYLLSQMGHYNDRSDVGCARFFPDLNVSEEQLTEIMHDKSNHWKIGRVAPVTELHEKFREFARVLEQPAAMQKIDPYRWKLVLNTYPVEFDRKAKDAIIDWLNKEAPNCIVGFLCKPFDAIHKSLFMKSDCIYVYNVNDLFTGNKELYEEIFKFDDKQDWVIKNKRIYGCKVMPDGLMQPNDNKEKMFENTELSMNLVVNYVYIPIPRINVFRKKE